MVAKNPLFRGRWTMKKFNATVINDIWPEVFFFTLVATMVSLVSAKTSHSLAISNQLLTVVGTVLGLVISFRTSSAYERYQDGRKMWTNITIASRNLSQMIWIHVPVQRANSQQTMLQNVIEKKSMINLVQAFSVSVKHFLRSEPGIYYQDLYPLVCFLPRYASPLPAAQTGADMLPLWHASEDDDHPLQHPTDHTSIQPSGHNPQRASSLPTPTHGTASNDGDSKSEASWYQSFTKNRGRRAAPIHRDKFDPEKALPMISSHRPLKPARNPPQASIYDYFPVFRFFKWLFRIILRRTTSLTDKVTGSRTALGRKKRPALVESNVPLEICLYLSSYSAFLMKNGLLQPAIATGITNNLSSLQDTMSNLERIGNTPLPFAYQAHLRMSLWLYLFFLPFQIYSAFKYLTIPGTAFASFLLLGFLEIGQEIENPFNYDLNDLDLDNFCLSIQRELHEITAHTSPEPHTFMFGAWNQPFAPADRRTAEDLTKDDTHEYRPADHDGDNTEKGLPSIRRTLLKSWRDVDKITRQV